MFDLCRFLSWFRPDHFFTGGSVIDRGLKQWFEVKNTIMMNLFLLQLLASQDVNWWTGVVWITCGLLWCFYQLFGLSFWRHPFTAEDPLVSKWWNAIFLQICSHEQTHLHLGWPEGEDIFSKFSFLVKLFLYDDSCTWHCNWHWNASLLSFSSS